MNTFTCLPLSLCSWDYIVTDSAQRESVVIMKYLTEQGFIIHGGAEYVIVKEGWLSGRWSLTGPSQCETQAVRSGFFRQRFQILVPGGEYELRPRHAFTRAFDIYDTKPTLIGSIAPVHAFTRRATIECTNEMPVVIQLFCFWLAAVTWRRVARSNNSSSATP